MGAVKKAKPFDAVMTAAAIYASALGEAQWLNGYRTGKPSIEGEKYPEEMRRWKRCDELHQELKKVLNRALKDARKAAATPKGGAK